MDAEEIREMAREAVEGLAAAAVHDPATYAAGGRPADRVAAASGALLALLEPSPAAHPDYAPMADAAAALIVLAGTDEMAYAGLMSGTTADVATLRPATLRGMAYLEGFLRAIGDDHEWSADMSAGTPVIRPQSALVRFAPTLTPRSLIDLVEPLLDGAAPAPGMR